MPFLPNQTSAILHSGQMFINITFIIIKNKTKHWQATSVNKYGMTNNDYFFNK